ncbi:MAG: hypothetical protein ACE5GE_17235, partial [Phycisphaerae bacterium]
MSGGEVPVGRFEAQGRLSLWVLVGLFVVAFAFRAGVGGWRLGRGDNPEVLTFPDEVQYWSMSRDLRAGRTLTDELGFHATRMPAYPAFLAIFPDSRGGVLGAIVCQWIIGALAAPLTALLAVRIGGVVAGVAAGLVVAADPGLVGLSSLLLTETPFVTGVAALWLVGWPIAAECRGVSAGRWLGLGVTAALCVYVRPSTVGLVGLWVVFLLARQR